MQTEPTDSISVYFAPYLKQGQTVALAHGVYVGTADPGVYNGPYSREGEWGKPFLEERKAREKAKAIAAFRAALT